MRGKKNIVENKHLISNPPPNPHPPTHSFSPHMARIANSVYRDVCPGDPTCRQFGFMDKYGTPTPMMEASLLYKLHGHNQKQGVSVDSNRFREVFTSKYGKGEL